MKRDILIDDAVRQVSEPVGDDENIDEIVQDLLDSVPDRAIGLAAPQIGIFKRVILVRLSGGNYISVNPVIVPEVNPSPPSRSVEGCLSLPRQPAYCLMRSPCVDIQSDRCMKVLLPDRKLIEAARGCMSHSLYHNAFIWQHEIDHLDGMLITDHKQVLTNAEMAAVQQRERKNKILVRRRARKSNPLPANIPHLVQSGAPTDDKQQTKKSKKTKRRRSSKR